MIQEDLDSGIDSLTPVWNVFNLKGRVGAGFDGLCLNAYPDAIPRRLNRQT